MTTWRALASLGVVLAGLGASACALSQAPCYLVSGGEARKLLVPGTILLDARPRGSAMSRIDGSIAVPRNEFSYRLTNLDIRSRLVVFAESRNAAYDAAEDLRARGFTVYELGTANDWKATETKCGN